MKILVIDDNPLHQESARQTLAGHNLTIVGTYDEAYKLLEDPYEEFEKVVYAEMEKCEYPFPSNDASLEEAVEFWRELGRKKREVALPSPRFDVVLTDLLMPASKRCMADKGLQYVGQEMAVGFGLVLMAVQCGAKYAAVVTDTSHHDHPAAALLDPFSSRCPHEYDRTGLPPRFNMNRTVVGYYQAPMTHVDGTTCPDCNGSGNKKVCYCIERNGGVPKSDCKDCRGTGRYCWTCGSTGKANGKDWGGVLAHLTTA